MNEQSDSVVAGRVTSAVSRRRPSRRIAFISSLCALCALCIISCAPYESAPYVVSKPRQVLGEKEGCFALAGVLFDLWNTSVKDISAVTVSFIVYDAETNDNPLDGTNLVMARFSGVIPAGSSEPFAVSLDGRLLAIPAKPYRLDFFTIPRIEYTDGSAWEDPFCAHYTRSY